jgi:hypothetical protein
VRACLLSPADQNGNYHDTQVADDFRDASVIIYIADTNYGRTRCDDVLLDRHA